jgi:hypothetical protein
VASCVLGFLGGVADPSRPHPRGLFGAASCCRPTRRANREPDECKAYGTMSPIGCRLVLCHCSLLVALSIRTSTVLIFAFEFTLIWSTIHECEAYGTMVTSALLPSLLCVFHPCCFRMLAGGPASLREAVAASTPPAWPPPPPLAKLTFLRVCRCWVLRFTTCVLHFCCLKHR